MAAGRKPDIATRRLGIDRAGRYRYGTPAALDGLGAERGAAGKHRGVAAGVDNRKIGRVNEERAGFASRRRGVDVPVVENAVAAQLAGITTECFGEGPALDVIRQYLPTAVPRTDKRPEDDYAPEITHDAV